RGDESRTTSPPIRTSPRSGACTPEMIRMSVDFPAPFSPSRAWTSPARTSKLTPFSAGNPARDLAMPCSSTMLVTRRPLCQIGPPALRGKAVTTDDALQCARGHGPPQSCSSPVDALPEGVMLLALESPWIVGIPGAGGGHGRRRRRLCRRLDRQPAHAPGVVRPRRRVRADARGGREGG